MMTNAISFHWDSFTFDNSCPWQYYTNKRCNKDDQVRVNSKYKDLVAFYKGVVTYLFLFFKPIFFMLCDTTIALRRYLKLFEDKGLCRICGKNVTVAEEEIVAVCLLLNEVGALPYDSDQCAHRSDKLFST